MESDIALINKVDLRLALAADEQFEKALGLYLAPVLLKFSSPHLEVRNTVLKVVEHVSPRINAARELKLPVAALLEQVKNPQVPQGMDSSMVRIYSLLFVSRGISRMSSDEQRALVPIVIRGLSDMPFSTESRLFSIFCKLLESWKVLSPHDKPDDVLGLSSTDEVSITKLIGKFLMLEPYSSEIPISMPGLSAKDTSFFTKEAGVSFTNNKDIYAVKLRLLDFLKAGFKDKNLAIPILIASANGSSTIKDSAEIWFKKLKVDLEDRQLTESLIDLYLGDRTTPAVNPMLQDKIVLLLAKSHVASSSSRISSVIDLGLSSEYHRLRQNIIHLVKWVNQNNEKSKDRDNEALLEYNKKIVHDLKSAIFSDGWPRSDPGMRSSSFTNQRQLQYEAFGNVLRSNPRIFTDDFSQIEFLLQSLEEETPELRSTIQDALSSLVVHIPKMSVNAKHLLKQAAKGYLSKDDLEENLQSCKYVVLKYINAGFRFDDSEARYLCILGTEKGNRSETIEEASRGLHPHWFNIFQSSNTLEFKSTADLFGENSSVVFPSFEAMVKLLQSEISTQALKRVFGRAMKFTLQTLVMHAVSPKNTVIVPDVDWEIRLDKALDIDETVISLLTSTIDSELNDNVYESFLQLIFDAFLFQYEVGSGIDPDTTYGTALLRLISLSPDSALTHLLPKLSGLLQVLDGRLKDDVSSSQVSEVIGIIGSLIDSDQEVLHLLTRLTPDISRAASVKGKTLSTAYLMSRIAARGRHHLLSQEMVVTFTDHLFEIFARLTSISLESISQLSLFGVLGPVFGSSNEIVLKYIDLLKPKIKKGDERSLLVLSELYLALTSENRQQRFEEIKDSIYDTHVSKQVEYTFTSGEAFVVLAAGWDAKNLKRKNDIRSSSVELMPPDLSKLEPILNTILEASRHTKPSLRKASCIWLLSIVQYCGHLEVVKKRAAVIQVSFMGFLSSNDELVQDSASRGLSIVYEMGDRELQDSLVHNLLTSFTDTGNSLAGSVDKETQLFQPDMLKTNEGSVSTYKDVLNLASDVGDPSLVYKFMSMAKSSALWSSRKGMAFGLGSILSRSSLDDILLKNKKLSNKLIPKLYRYRFDPSTSVSASMGEIWNTLVKNTGQTVRDYLPLILQELLLGTGNREWRVRQASAAALSDLIQMIPLDEYEYDLQDLWNRCFRAMDDIKDSVRKEGDKLAKNLASNVIRIIDSKEGTKDSDEKSASLLKDLIPFLLGTKGLQSDSEDVRKFALETILRVCKVNRKAVKAYVPELIETFVGLMSSLEPEVINYLVLNADKYNMRANDIDAKRLQSLGASPIMDAIERLLDMLDESILEEFIMRLQSTVKKSVGLPSKAAGSRVVVLLVTKHRHFIEPYGDKLLTICTSQFNDRNDATSSSFASAAGYVCRVASLKTIKGLANKINKLFFESENERDREIASVVSESVSRHSGERFMTFAASFLPLAFIGKNDLLESVKSNFGREWDENTSGNDSAIRLYLNEILSFFEHHLSSTRFEIRQILGKTASDMSNSITDFDLLSDDAVKKLLTLLIASTRGKSWEGKELVLESLVLFAKKTSNVLRHDPTLLDEVKKVTLVEAKRRNRAYQKHSVKLLGRFINTYPSPDAIELYVEIMDQILSDNYLDDSDDENDMDVDSNGPTKIIVRLEEERLSFIANAVESFAAPVNDEYLILILTKSQQLFKSDKLEVSWRSKIQIADLLTKLIEKLQGTTLKDEHFKPLLENWSTLQSESLGPAEIENVKISFLRFSRALIDFLEAHNYSEAREIREKIKTFAQSESSNIVLTEVKKTID